MFDPGPCVYMDKIAVGPEAADAIDINAPIKANLEAVAKALGEDVERHHRGDPRPPAPRRHHPRVPRGRCPHPPDPGRRRRRRDLGRVAQLRDRHPVRHRRHARRRDRRVRAQGDRRRDAGPAVAPQRRRAHAPRSTRATTSTGCSRPTTSSRATTCSSPPPASPTASSSRRALLGRRREHADPRDAVEVGHHPHHRRDAPAGTKLMRYSAVKFD